MNKICFVVISSAFLMCHFVVRAEDGTYDATVTTDSGSYSVPVEVEDGEVTMVYWPNGGDIHVDGAEIIDGEASGTNSQGDFIDISLDDYNDYSEEQEDSEY